jgi:hypothetical protein
MTAHFHQAPGLECMSFYLSVSNTPSGVVLGNRGNLFLYLWVPVCVFVKQES